MLPKSAYSAMSTDERLTLKLLKAEIVAFVREKHDGVARGVERVSPLPADPVPESRVTQTDERKEEDAAEVRRKLGWDVGVLNERTGFRYRE